MTFLILFTAARQFDDQGATIMRKPNFYKFNHPSKRQGILVPLACFLIGFALTLLVVFPDKKDNLSGVILVIGYIIICYVVAFFTFLFFYLYPQRGYKELINELKEKNLLELAERDFRFSEKYVCGKARLGKTYLFGQSNGLLIPVEELKSIRITMTEHYGDEDYKKWTILITTSDKERCLCTLRSDHDYSFREKDWNMLTSKLSDMNPDLIVDDRVEIYRKKASHHR